MLWLGLALALALARLPPLALAGYSPVSVVKLATPQYGVEGRHAVLMCSHSSQQPVYSVRWYKNGKEFFR